MNGIQKVTATIFAACALTFAIAGCDRKESPAKTDADVSKAQVEADKDVAAARQKAADSTVGAQKNLSEAKIELGHENAEARRDVTIAEAEATHKISIEKCEAMDGDLRAACKKQADADMDSAKAYAKANEKATDPKP
jgi:uncharacterized lipoprotein YehR (DUF1307 family)